MLYLNKKRALILIFLMCLSATTYAFYAEFYQNVTPCPLCIAERVILMIIGILALIFALHNSKNFLMRIYGIIIATCAAIGLKISIHHIWLIHLPADQQPQSCGMPPAVLYNKLPLASFLKYIFAGDAECGKVNWSVLGINAPTMVVIWCVIIFILSCYVIFAKTRDKSIMQSF